MLAFRELKSSAVRLDSILVNRFWWTLVLGPREYVSLWQVMRYPHMGIEYITIGTMHVI